MKVEVEKKEKGTKKQIKKVCPFFGRYYLTYRVDPAPDLYPRNTHI
jgi:hypothetical protein